MADQRTDETRIPVIIGTGQINDRPADDAEAGPAEIETYTVIYDREAQPKFGVILARTPDDRRAIARVPVEDEAMIAFLTSGETEPVGTNGLAIRVGAFSHWSMG